MKKIKFFDILSEEVKLKFHGSERYKSKLGGTLGLVSILTCVGFVIYFFIDFLLKTNSTIISGQAHTQNTSNPFNIPTMLRISDSFSQVLLDKERVWNITRGTGCHQGILNQKQNIGGIIKAVMLIATYLNMYILINHIH